MVGAPPPVFFCVKDVKSPYTSLPQDGDAEQEPFDDVGWLEGPPQRTVSEAMQLVDQCWSADYMMAEFLTESEIRGEITNNARPLQHATALSHLTLAKKLLRENPAVLTETSSRLSVVLRAVSAACVGFGCANSTAWKAGVQELVAAGAVDTFVMAFNEIIGPIFPVAKQVFSGEQDIDSEEIAGPTLAMRAILNALCGLLLGSGSGLPHSSKEETHTCQHMCLDDLLLQLFMLIRDAPAAPSILPGKKLVMLAHVVLAALCGPVDLKPASWGEGWRRSMRWVGDGAVEQYITSVLQSGANCSRLHFLTADQLRACHYRFYSVAMRQALDNLDTCQTGPQLAENPCPEDRSIPIPVREALAVFAVKLAQGQLKRQDTVIIPQAHLDAAQPDISQASVADLCESDAISLHIDDIREKPSLTPQFPPRKDDHLVPNDIMSTGTPTPALWHSSNQYNSVRQEDKPLSSPGELLFRMLYTVLPGFVVGVFKLFLSSLPGEDAARSSNLPEAEAAVFGATSPQELARHRNVTMKCVTGLLLHILKLISKHSTIQAEVVLQAMADSNGLLLLLKYLHQNSVLLLTGVDHVAEAGWDEAIEVPCPLPPNEGAHVPWGATATDLDETLSNKCRSLVVLDGDIHTVVMCDARNLVWHFSVDYSSHHE